MTETIHLNYPLQFTVFQACQTIVGWPHAYTVYVTYITLKQVLFGVIIPPVHTGH